MNRAELVESVAQRTGMKKALVIKVIEAFEDEVQKEVSEGNKVALMGFGSFERVVSKRRSARNMVTGERIDIPSSYRPRFSFGSRFKQRVRGNEST